MTYLFGDHLGSTSASIDANGNLAKQGYFAFGQVRYNVGTLTTDYTFTGQKSDVSDGLMFYGARYYDANIGRFNQPDTITQNPYNPQDLNRYAYTRNNPLRYTDPTGHMVADDGSPTPPVETPTSTKPLVNFDQDDGQTWTDKEKETIEEAADDVARKLADRINRRNRLAWKTGEYEGASPPQRVTSEEAFYSAYGGPVTFRRVSAECDCYGSATPNEPNVIRVYSNATAANIIGNKRFVVHELGHVFDNNIASAGTGALDPTALDPTTAKIGDEIKNNRGNHVTGYDPSKKGFSRTDLGYITGDFPWEQHPTYKPGGNTAGEDLADMFLNWTYNSFNYMPSANGAGKARYDWMDTNMGVWLK